MEKFNGKYQTVKSINYADYLVAIGVVKDKSKAPANDNSTLEMTVNGNKITIKNSAHSYAPTLTLNEEIEDKTPDAGVLKTTLKLDGGNLVVEATLSDGSVAKRVYSLSGSELTLTLTSSKPGVPEAKVTFKKL